MTKEEFAAHVKHVICDGEFASMTGIDKAVAQITDQWESDVNDARIVGQDEATSAIESYNQPCMGPCCGGSINTYNGQY